MWYAKWYINFNKTDNATEAFIRYKTSEGALYGGSSVNSKSLAFDVWLRLKKEILSLAYPPGAVLQERVLAQKYGVSRTPVREALQRLAQEGWVNINARRNIQVRNASLSDMCSLFAARRALEIDAVEQIISAKISGKLTWQMNNALKGMEAARNDLYSFIVQDQEFHSIFFFALNNRYMEKFWRSVNEDMIWFGMLAMDNGRYDNVLLEHRKIVAALDGGRKTEIRSAVTEHLDITERALMDRIHDDKDLTSQIFLRQKGQ